MASIAVQEPVQKGRVHRLKVVQLLATGGVTAGIVFVICWLATLIPTPGPTHAYLRLFTTADSSSIGSLMEGTAWSLLFGALAGALFATIYNAFGRFSH